MATARAARPSRAPGCVGLQPLVCMGLQPLVCVGLQPLTYGAAAPHTRCCSLSHTVLQPLTHLVELIVELEAAWLRADQPLHQVLQHTVRCGQPLCQQEQQAAPTVAAATTTHTTTTTTHTTHTTLTTTTTTTIAAATAAARCARCVGPTDEVQQGERGKGSQGEVDPPRAQLRGELQPAARCGGVPRWHARRGVALVRPDEPRVQPPLHLQRARAGPAGGVEACGREGVKESVRERERA